VKSRKGILQRRGDYKTVWDRVSQGQEKHRGPAVKSLSAQRKRKNGESSEGKIVGRKIVDPDTKSVKGDNVQRGELIKVKKVRNKS